MMNELLSNFLGFGSNAINFDTHDKTYVGISKPKLNKFKQIYIYSSIVNPIQVGGVRVPLLRSIWINPDHDIRDVIHETIDNPMYLPISSNRINLITTEIRNDAGMLIEFPHGSITSLTLHFQRII
jgi:hypothetical protein